MRKKNSSSGPSGAAGITLVVVHCEGSDSRSAWETKFFIHSSPLFAPSWPWLTRRMSLHRTFYVRVPDEQLKKAPVGWNLPWEKLSVWTRKWGEKIRRHEDQEMIYEPESLSHVAHDDDVDSVRFSWKSLNRRTTKILWLSRWLRFCCVKLNCLRNNFLFLHPIVIDWHRLLFASFSVFSNKTPVRCSSSSFEHTSQPANSPKHDRKKRNKRKKKSNLTQKPQEEAAQHVEGERSFRIPFSCGPKTNRFVSGLVDDGQWWVRKWLGIATGHRRRRRTFHNPNRSVAL